MKRRKFLKYSVSLGLITTSSGLIRGLGIPSAWAVTIAPSLSDPAIQPLFTEPVTSALSPDFKFAKTQVGDLSKYSIGVSQIVQETGLVNSQGQRLSTTVWGYGTSEQAASWPGRTIEVNSNEPVQVKWLNQLSQNGTALPHLLPVDDTIHWCYGLPGYEAVSIANDGVPIVTHVHGAHVDSDSDGNPEYFFGVTTQSRGPRWTTENYFYDNSQSAGALWYHDHALGITRLNVYAGLAGFYFIRDEIDTGNVDNPNALPAGNYEHAYVVQDRMFRDNGELFFPAFNGDPKYDEFISGTQFAQDFPDKPSIFAEFFGDHILVNGKIWPKTDVEPRHYRLRLLNGSDSRFMKLQFRSVPMGDTDFTNASAPLPFHIVGSDQGLFAAPVSVTEIDFIPAERLDIVIDFSALSGSRIIMENSLKDSRVPALSAAAGTAFPDRRTNRVMAFDVLSDLSSEPDNFDPAQFQSNYSTNQNPVDKTRKLVLFEGTDEFGRLQPMLGTAEPVVDVTGATVEGALAWHSPITENPQLGATEIWEFHNTTPDAHPIHLHLIHFDILDRTPFKANKKPKPVPQQDGPNASSFVIESEEVDQANVRPLTPNEQGPKDMVVAPANEITRIKMTFDKPGRYVWHCHILSHEDHDMMRPMYIGPLVP
jgi:FtsP/CotA-like multicopper oxidase with cupredoxin domain